VIEHTPLTQPIPEVISEVDPILLTVTEPRWQGILAKRDEYQRRFDDRWPLSIDPELAVSIDMKMSDLSTLFLLVRMECIDDMAQARSNGETEFMPARFIDEFLTRHRSLLPTFPEAEPVQNLRRANQRWELLAQTQVIRAYCEGTEQYMTGGTPFSLIYTETPARA
jgi:malate synthase